MPLLLKLTFLILFLISLAGCISSYGTLPPEASSQLDISQRQKDVTLHYKIEPLRVFLEKALQSHAQYGGVFQHRPTNESYQELEISITQSPIVGTAISVNHLPAKGFFVDVQVNVKFITRIDPRSHSHFPLDVRIDSGFEEFLRTYRTIPAFL